MQELRGRVAVVTGGASGVGKALAKAFLGEGMKVAIADVEAPALETAAEELGPGVLSVVTDVSDPASVQALADRVFDEHGACHILCNNAGVAAPNLDLWETEPSDFQWVHGVNVGGVAHGVQAFVPRMIEGGEEGLVLNTSSSDGGVSPLAQQVVYASSKAAISIMTECLHAQLVGRGTRLRAAIFYPSGGLLATGIWTTKRNRPERLARKASVDPSQETTFEAFMEGARKAGYELPVQDLDELAQFALQGIRNEDFVIMIGRETIEATLQERAAKLAHGECPIALQQLGLSQAGATPGRATVSKLLIISADCHAGALPNTYEQYMPKRFHEPARRWWLAFVREMMERTGTFFDQEAVDAYTEDAGGGRGLMEARGKHQELGDDEVLRLLSDGTSPFAPRPGEFDLEARVEDLDADGVAAEVIFPQMVAFGGGLIQYRHPTDPEQNLEGLRAYNRWLADFCSGDPGRHAGVALINVDDIDVAVAEIRQAKELGLFGGVLLPTSTGPHPFYHHPRYEPLWQVCEELGMPLHAHSGWSPDYGDVASATAMYITEVDMWAHRPFAALMWSGAFERHPELRFVLTETGCSWILETLRLLEYKADLPIFKYFTQDLSLRPREYFERQCFIGASFMPRSEGADRHRIGIDKLMWGTDYPHLEGTWPHTHEALRDTFADYPEAEIRALLGTNAAAVYGFDLERLDEVVARIGPELAELRGEGAAG